MESNISVPTDNVYKFYAISSLLVIIFSIGAVLYLNKTTNDLAFNSVVELEALKSASGPPGLDAKKKMVLERRLEIAVENKTLFLYSLGAISGIAIVGLIYGFAKWHKDLQPVIDETAKVQLEIAKLQLEKMKRELDATSGNEDITSES
ncbi:hypothetical protein NHH82_25155 [Oxalobacteraceae bacterium OTU3REALA1]|nr:hypothetical protein NHH82_25155 [Oxalobacteraceae bacterium OTU3REALA1]